MEEKSVLKKDKSFNPKKVMISDKRFSTKHVQELIYFAKRNGIIEEVNKNITRYIFEYNNQNIVGEYYKKVKKEKFEKENKIFSKFKIMELMKIKVINANRPIMAIAYEKKNQKFEGWIFYYYKEFFLSV